MRHYVGFDVGKGAHWVCVLDGQGEVVLSRKVEATEEALEAVCSEIAALGVSDERVVGIDLTGGVAALLEAVLLERGEKVRYLPGTAVNKARETYPGGEQKSDSKDAPSSSLTN
jgi:predicted NBD/HSP70 family sugar kinase